MDYKNLQQCVTRATERSGVQNSDLAGEILEVTAGKDSSSAKVYRPYWTAAEMLDQRRGQIESADGAKFRDVMNVITALRRLQWTIDSTLQLTVPPGTSKATFNPQRTVQRTRNIPVQSVL